MKQKFIAALLAASLLTSPAALAAGAKEGAHEMPGMAMESKKATAPGYTATADAASPVEAGVPRSLTVRLKDSAGKPLGLERIEIAHTRRVHLLVIDESLSDYQHLHPEPGKEDGSFAASFTAKTGHDYKVWVDVTPVGGAQAFVPVVLKGSEDCKKACVDQTPIARVEQDGLIFTLSFEEPPRAGKAVMGKLEVTDASGKAVTKLEPVMGAYAHIVGFGEAGDSVAHVHPMGEEPKAETDRGTAPLSFHIEPAVSGFIKLWAQVRYDGKDLFVPFGFDAQK